MVWDGVILLKLASKNVDYVLCNSSNINKKFREYYINGRLYQYTKIFVTDLHLNTDTLKIIDNNQKLRHKVLVFDHNESALKYNTYNFVSIIPSDENEETCATCIFYKYLVKNNMLKSTPIIDTFCELVRRHDVGIWKNYNDPRPRDLSLLLEGLERERYINIMYSKLKHSKSFTFSKIEKYIIDSQKNRVDQKVAQYLENIMYKTIQGYKAGVVFIAYEYRNEVAQYLRDHKERYCLDLVVMIAMENKSISFRNINPNLNLKPIAEIIGGRSHFGAAGADIEDEDIQKILNDIFPNGYFR